MFTINTYTAYLYPLVHVVWYSRHFEPHDLNARNRKISINHFRPEKSTWLTWLVQSEEQVCIHKPNSTLPVDCAKKHMGISSLTNCFKYPYRRNRSAPTHEAWVQNTSACHQCFAGSYGIVTNMKSLESASKSHWNDIGSIINQSLRMFLEMFAGVTHLIHPTSNLCSYQLPSKTSLEETWKKRSVNFGSKAQSISGIYGLTCVDTGWVSGYCASLWILFLLPSKKHSYIYIITFTISDSLASQRNMTKYGYIHDTASAKHLSWLPTSHNSKILSSGQIFWIAVLCSGCWVWQNQSALHV